MNARRRKLIAVLAMAMVAISTAGPLIVASGMPAPAVAFWRALLGGSILLPACLLLERGALRALPARDVAMIALAGTGLGAHYLLWIGSLAYTSVSSSTVLVTTNPIWVAIGGRIFLREPTSRGTWIAIAVGTLGATILALADGAAADGSGPGVAAGLLAGRRPLLGDAMALGGAIVGSVTLLLGRSLRTRVPVLTYSTVCSLTAVPILAAAIVVTGDPVVPPTARQMAIVVSIAVVPHLLGGLSLNWALGLIPAARVALVILAEPVGATLLAWAFLAQRPGPLSLVGGALVLAAVGLNLLAAERSALRAPSGDSPDPFAHRAPSGDSPDPSAHRDSE